MVYLLFIPNYFIRQSRTFPTFQQRELILVFFHCILFKNTPWKVMFENIFAPVTPWIYVYVKRQTITDGSLWRQIYIHCYYASWSKDCTAPHMSNLFNPMQLDDSDRVSFILFPRYHMCSVFRMFKSQTIQ